jgi:hypothetical protein
MPARHSRRWFNTHGVRVVDRPWYALSESQRENRFDSVAWHEREIFLEEILKHPALNVRRRAERSNQDGMQIMIRAWKEGVDLTAVSIEGLKKLENWHGLPRRPLGRAREPEPPKPPPASTLVRVLNVQPLPLAAPPVAGTFSDLSKTLDDIVARASGCAFSPVGEAPGAAGGSGAAQSTPAAETPQQASQAGDPPSWAGAIPDLEDLVPSAENVRKPDLADIAAIRDKLVRNGKVRLDVEALTAYLLTPSFFAIANGLVPEWWQTDLLDSYAPRLGCLASRQCGKSLVIALKACAFCACNPGSTVLVLAPTLRQSTELLSKVLAVVMNAGLKVAASNQFQLILGGDKLTPGEGSRIVALPGSNEDSGASARGYAADMLVLEEASFLKDDVISSVLPSIAARPRAQLIGISSAGIIGSYFHSVMTSPQSRWEKMIVTAAQSGRFTWKQLQEMRRDLGEAKFRIEFLCQWGSVGDSIFDAETMEKAFGSSLLDPAEPAEANPEAAFGHLDLEKLFQARPFERRYA